MLVSKAFEIWRRLGTRFQLEDQPATGMGVHVATTIFPVTQADELLKTAMTQRTSAVNLDVTAGQFVIVFTVPDDERWRLRSAWRSATTAATQMAVRVGADFANISLSQTGEDVVANLDMLLESGNEVGMIATDNVGDNSRDMHIVYEFELAFAA